MISTDGAPRDLGRREAPHPDARSSRAAPSPVPITTINGVEIVGVEEPKLVATLTMVYGPIAAFLVELFPARIVTLVL